MTNKQKAENMTKGFLKQGLIKKSRLQELLIKAMQWKEQQLIDEACNLMQHWILEHDYVDIIELEYYIKQQMKEL